MPVRSVGLLGSVLLGVVTLGLLAAIGCEQASGDGKKSDKGATAASASASDSGSGPNELLNVSYDPTRELWKELNAAFVAHYEKTHGRKVEIKQSHGGSSSQARSVIDGNEADVVSLAMPGDIDAIQKAGLIQEGWAEKNPNGSLPYFSTIVFVVRKGNPKNIHDWKDLIQDGVEIITPHPKTSGNGKLSFLAAWASIVARGGTEEQAKDFLTKLYQHVKVLDSGARGATATFSQKKLGDVHLTWESEAFLEVAEAEKGELEIVAPPISVRAEPRVAIVDSNVDRKGTRKLAEDYLAFVFTPEAQEIIAKNYYRPHDPEVLKEHADNFFKVELVPVQKIAGTWEAAEERFFGPGGVFETIYQPGSN